MVKSKLTEEDVQLAEERPLKISFVMPTYNSADTVAESVESITQGNFEDGDELIIVDGCSTDNTVQVLSDLKEKYHFLKLILNENYIGCPAARNVGIGTASNSIIFNLDSDNLIVPGSIKELKQFMIGEEAEVAAFGEIHFFRDDKNKITHKWICCPGILTLADLLSGSINPAASGNYMFTKESWHRVGKYWEYGAGLHEAWGFSLKQIANGSKFVVMAGSYYLHRFGYSSLYVRESAKKHEGSLMATKMIKPFINLLDAEDAKYIMSEKGSREWFDNNDKRPIKLKYSEIGRTGKVVDVNGNPLPKKPSNFQIMRGKLIGTISRTLPNSIKDGIRRKK